MNITEYLAKVEFPEALLDELTSYLQDYEFKDVPDELFQLWGFDERIGHYHVRVSRKYNLILKYSYISNYNPPDEFTLPTLFLTEPINFDPKGGCDDNDEYNYYVERWIIQPYVPNARTDGNWNYCMEYLSNLQTELEKQLGDEFDMRFCNVCEWEGRPVMHDW